MIEAEQPGNDQVGKLLDANIIDVDGFVVPLAPVGNRIFQCGDPALQLHEVLVGPQFGICFGDSEDLPKSHAQHAFGSPQRGDVVIFACAGDTGAGFGDSGEGLLLELLVLATDLHQIG
ncbi:hypothetical protein SDC9_204608 [bioreactor metagenome]|uniref:Uncharacterized protein n=1 Tax=bioreactor metagenome TaxID=1076179 RepID=A0A645IZP1_9ZZZZ